MSRVLRLSLIHISSENEISQKIVALIHKWKQIERVVLVIEDLQVLLENGNTGKSTTLINLLQLMY